MIENPLKVQNYELYREHVFRKDEVNKFLGPSKMTFNSYQKEQYEPRTIDYSQTMFSNQNNTFNYQPNTTNKADIFRERKKHLEIQKDMIFKYDNVQSVKQQIKNQSQKFKMRSSSNFTKDVKSQSFKDKVNEKNKIAFMKAKNLMPDLHEKTFFKSLDTIYNDQPCNLSVLLVLVG